MLNIKGGVHAKAEALASLFCHDLICLTETWLTEFDQLFTVSMHTCYSAFRRARDGPGRHSGGLSVYVSDRLHEHVEFVKTAEDANTNQYYLWLKLKCVVQDCPEVYF